MAQVNILIKTDGTDATSSELNTSNGNAGLSATSNEAITPNGTGSSRNLVTRSVFAHQLASAGLNALKSTLNYAKSNYGNFTGDYLGQQKIDSVFSTATEAMSFGGSIISGAVSGAAFGWVGAAVGAVVGAVIGAANTGINYAQATTDQKIRISRVNAQANYNMQRIGSILTNGNR